MTRFRPDPATMTGLGKVLEAEDARFTSLVREAGLDPKRDLRGGGLAGIVLQPGESLAGHDFSGADLAGAVFRRVDLKGARFLGADLTGADFRGTNTGGRRFSAEQRAAMRRGRLPAALRHGPNRLWPPDLAAAIEAAIRKAGSDEIVLWTLAREALDAGRARLAEHLYAILVDWETGIAGPESPDTLEARHGLARAILAQGRAAEAEVLLRALFPVLERVKGAEDLFTLAGRHTLAHAILDQGRAAEAETLLRALLPVLERARGAEHADTLTTRHNLAHAILDQGRAAEAEALFRALLAVLERVQGAEHAHTLATRHAFARALLEQGRTDEAQATLATLPADGGDPDPLRRGQTAMLRAWAADLAGDAAAAAARLSEAEGQLLHLDPAHYARRELARYRETRVPGGAGGTMVWAETGAAG